MALTMLCYVRSVLSLPCRVDRISRAGCRADQAKTLWDVDSVAQRCPGDFPCPMLSTQMPGIVVVAPRLQGRVASGWLLSWRPSQLTTKVHNMPTTIRKNYLLTVILCS
jgi:hypothetical protein